MMATPNLLTQFSRSTSVFHKSPVKSPPSTKTTEACILPLEVEKTRGTSKLVSPIPSPLSRQNSSASSTSLPSPLSCSSCGVTIPVEPPPDDVLALLNAHAHIAELEVQVGKLSRQAEASVHRWAEYEAEIARLRKALEDQEPTLAPNHYSVSLLPTPHQASTSGGLRVETNASVGQRSPSISSLSSDSPSLASSVFSATSTQDSIVDSPPSLTPSSKPLPAGTSTASIPRINPPPVTPSSYATNTLSQSEPLSSPPSTTRSSFFPVRFSFLSSKLSSSSSDSNRSSSTNTSGGQSAAHQPQTGQITMSRSTPSQEDELRLELANERSRRVAAEGELSESNKAIEELTAQLFTEANQMVAEERKTRAYLEQRVEILETRDIHHRRRLERLERAIQCIQRVHKVLNTSTVGPNHSTAALADRGYRRSIGSSASSSSDGEYN